MHRRDLISIWREFMDSILPAQPETYLQLVRRSLRLYRLSFKKVILFSALLAIIAFIPRFIMDFTGQPIFFSLSFFSPKHLWVMGINIIGLIFFIAIIWDMHCVIINEHEPFIQDVQIALKKFILVFLASILQTIILVGIAAMIYGVQQLVLMAGEWLHNSPLLIMFFSAIFIAEFFLVLYTITLFIFVLPLIAIENKSIIGSIERSIFLVWNHWLRTFLFQM